MIDHLIRFNSEAEAKSDPIVGKYYDEGWRGDCCFPGQQVWRPEDDTVVEGDIAHHPLPYWYITVALETESEELRNHSTCMLVWDRDKNECLYSALPLEELRTYSISPVPAGSNYFEK